MSEPAPFEFFDLGVTRREDVVARDFNRRNDVPVGVTLARNHQQRSLLAPGGKAAAALLGNWNAYAPSEEQRDLDAEALGTINGGNLRRLREGKTKAAPPRLNKPLPNIEQHHRNQRNRPNFLQKSKREGKTTAKSFGKSSGIVGESLRQLRELIKNDDKGMSTSKTPNPYTIMKVPPASRPAVRHGNRSATPSAEQRPARPRLDYKVENVKGSVVGRLSHPFHNKIPSPGKGSPAPAVTSDASASTETVSTFDNPTISEINEKSPLPTDDPDVPAPLNVSKASVSPTLSRLADTVAAWNTVMKEAMTSEKELVHGITFHLNCTKEACEFRDVPQEVLNEYAHVRSQYVVREYQDYMAANEVMERSFAIDIVKRPETFETSKEVAWRLGGMSSSRYAH